MVKNKKILVVGESCRDIFVYANTERLAPDIPVPVLQIVKQTENPGMAKNVERNVKALCRSCDIATNKNWHSITKTRYMHEKTNHGFLRVDTNHKMDPANVRKLPLKRYDVIAISDYDKGFMTEDDIRYICERHDCVFVDTKKLIGSFLNRSAYIKINKKEYEDSLPLSEHLKRKIIFTTGEHGAEFNGTKYPTKKIEVKDYSGAGDSFFAALVVRYAETKDIEDAIRFANLCAAEVVQHRGVSVIKKPREKV